MSDNNENLSNADLKTLANQFVQLADASAFNYTAQGSAEVLNKLVKAKETGLEALMNLMASDKISFSRVQNLILLIRAIGCDLEDFSEETGEIAISFLLDTIFNAKSHNARRVALALLGEILSWCFPDKKEPVDNELLSLLFV